VREFELDAGASGPTVSYFFEGRQYIVVAIGDPEHNPELVAFSLPTVESKSQNEGTK